MMVGTLRTTFLVFPSWLLEKESHTQYSSDMAPLRCSLSPSTLDFALCILTSSHVFCDSRGAVLIIL